MNIAEIKKTALPILKRHGVIKAAIFGSFARGDADKKSDIDFLVKLKSGTSLFDVAGLKLDLEKKLGYAVDIISYKYIYPPLKKIILGEQKIIYEKRKKRL